MKLFAALALCASAAAYSQDWPSRPIHIVVPYAAGGPVDLSARLIAPKLQQALGQPVIVENRVGAGGNIGADAIAKSAPDGYSLVIGAIATHAINPALYKNVPYDPVRDFRHIALLVQVPNVLVVNNDLPARSVADLVVLAKREPGKLDFASGSTGSTGHLAGELFKQMTGTYMVHIPYKGSAPAVSDMLAGRVALMFDNLASALPNIRADKVRVLAVTTLRRSSFLPDVPTLDELGLKGFDMTTWWGLMAPAKTPQPVVDRLAAECAKALPELSDRWRAMGSELPSVRTPAGFTAFVERERKLYAELVKRSGATAD
ncbi:MAG: tripartite tricarboxylate transporter substrate binding protein [Betaproteobacteria bacterium]|nr:tripartite tricarboxylate transporter substrate binding protein [Betaproteobacteria bacterium]MBV9361410.1 tripartite tricarboxylate transporter substrate binding protein [Betaproteobacteria bacterium]